jgi:hypothetical protein
MVIQMLRTLMVGLFPRAASIALGLLFCFCLAAMAGEMTSSLLIGNARIDTVIEPTFSYPTFVVAASKRASPMGGSDALRLSVSDDSNQISYQAKSFRFSQAFLRQPPRDRFFTFESPGATPRRDGMDYCNETRKRPKSFPAAPNATESPRSQLDFA